MLGADARCAIYSANICKATCAGLMSCAACKRGTLAVAKLCRERSTRQLVLQPGATPGWRFGQESFTQVITLLGRGALGQLRQLL